MLGEACKIEWRSAQPFPSREHVIEDFADSDDDGCCFSIGQNTGKLKVGEFAFGVRNEFGVCVRFGSPR